MIGKKGTTDTLSFLIGVIIFLLIVIPIGIAVYHYMFAKSGMERTLTMLVERTSELEDGEDDSIIGYIDNGYVLISFEKDQAQFGSTETFLRVKRWTCKGVGDETFTMYWGINKPSQCKGRACLCACGESGKNIPLIGDWLDIAGPDLCDGAKCILYDENKNPRFYGGANCEYGAFIAPESPTLEINYERQGQTIGICEELPCISKDVQKAREIFNEVYANYMACKKYESNDCICDKIYFADMPWDHNVEFSSDGAKTTMKLTDDNGPLRGVMEIEDDLFGAYYPSTDTEKLIATWKTDKQPHPGEGYADDVFVWFGDNKYYGTADGVIQLYKSKTGNVNFVVERGDILQEKDYCRVKESEGSEPAGYEEGMGCSFERAGAGIAMDGFCRKECTENEYEIGRRGDKCDTLRCCVSTPDARCVEKEGSCYSGCEPSSLTPIEGENLCKGENAACCKPGSPCENIANGECRSACEERLNEEQAPGSYFTSPACGSGYLCCIKKAENTVLLGAG